jgi:UTP-glucose-1-phosphate uridylyltransferase
MNNSTIIIPFFNESFELEQTVRQIRKTAQYQKYEHYLTES